MKVQFLDPARTEFMEAVAYYGDQEEGLGLEFSAEVGKALERILRYPEAWPLISKRTRRCRISRFPYGIIYQIRQDTLVIVAVMHLHREPHSWRTRVPRRSQ